MLPGAGAANRADGDSRSRPTHRGSGSVLPGAYMWAIDAVLADEASVPKQTVPSEGRDEALGDDILLAVELFDLVKSLHLAGNRFGPFAFKQPELFSLRDQEIDLVPVMITVEVNVRPTAVMGELADDLPERQGLEKRSEQTALAQRTRRSDPREKARQSGVKEVKLR